MVYRSTASDGNSSSNVTVSGDVLTLSYSEVNEIRQGLATDAINVNPYAVIVQVGDITLSPETDEWRDVVTRARNVTVTEQAPVATRQNQNWRNWEWNWAGRRFDFNDNFGFNQFAGFDRWEFDLDVPLGNNTGSIRTSSDTRVLSVTLLPFMRSREVHFFARGLLPNTTHKAFFSGVDVTDYCREETFVRNANQNVQDSSTANNTITEHPDGKSDLISNSNGEIQGSFFVPNTASLRFRAGTREFKLRDETATLDSNAISRAYGTYTAQGTLETRETTTTTTIVRPAPLPRFRRIDPVAQSFVIERPEGAFISSIDLCFQSVSSSVPVRVEIRQMETGLPTATALPGAVKWLNPSDVSGKATNTPNFNNSSNFVNFEFDEPVYLEGNREYAIVVLSDSTDYNIWTAVVGNFRVGSTTQRVMKQPTLGSFFKSQNGSTWNPDQNRDLMFRLNRCNFNTSGTAYFENVTSIPVQKLGSNPLQSTNSSSELRVIHPDHGMFTGSTVTLAGATTFNGVDASNINGDHTITVDTLDSYTIDTGDTASGTGSGGGSSVTATENYTFNEAFFNANELILPSTRGQWGLKTTSGKSIAGSETPYSKNTSFNSILSNERIEFTNPRTVASSVNSTNNMSGERALTLRCQLSTTNSLVSPVIDLQRLSLNLIGNRIDRPAASAVTGFNVPDTFVAETTTLTTDDTTIQSAAKHVTIPITLESPAVGIRLITGVNRPSDSYLSVYYKVLTSGSDESFSDIDWTEATIDEERQTDDDPSIYRDYEYTIEEDQFTSFMFKFVMTSSNSSNVPRIRDIRAIALTT